MQVIIGLQVFSPSTLSIKMYDNTHYEYPAMALAIGKQEYSARGLVKYQCNLSRSNFMITAYFQGWCIAFSSVLLIPVMAVRAYVRAAEQTGPDGSLKTVICPTLIMIHKGWSNKG